MAKMPKATPERTTHKTIKVSSMTKLPFSFLPLAPSSEKDVIWLLLHLVPLYSRVSFFVNIKFVNYTD